MYFCAFCHLHARACACVCRCFVMNLLMYLAAPGHERRTVLRRSFGVETIGTIMRFIGRAFCLVVVLSSLLLLLFVYMQLLLFFIYIYIYIKGGRGGRNCCYSHSTQLLISRIRFDRHNWTNLWHVVIRTLKMSTNKS